MIRKRKQINVIDIEATCWDGPTPPEEVAEIIEIGITPLVIVDGPAGIYSKGVPESIVVKPQHSEISKYCTDLTGWTQEGVNAGMTYAEAIKILRKKYDSKNNIFASWGKYDDKIFYRMAKLYNVPYPFNNDHLNIKALFGALYGQVRGLKQAMDFLGMEFVGNPHSGVDDSSNIADVLFKLIGENV